MRRLFLLFHGRFPGEKAASLFAAKSAEAFAEQGLLVEVLVPKRKGTQPRQSFEYFGVARNFAVIELPTVDFYSWKIPHSLAFYLNFLAFSVACFRYLRKQKITDRDVAYSNESLPLFIASLTGLKAFYEMHDFPESKFRIFGLLLSRYVWILIHNRWKVNEFRRIFPGVKAKVICEPNAVDPREFELSLSKEEARRTLDLKLDNDDRKIIVYTGHLFGWKGVETLAEAAKLLGGGYLVFFIGGTEKDVSDFKRRYGHISNIRILGHRPHKEIPIWQKAADALVLPNTAKEAISAYYTSPMKLFEYMASLRPVVASDIPSIREIVDETCAVMVKPDDAEALAEAIRSVFERSDIDTLTGAALVRVRSHTWRERAKRIIAFM